jgi:hypothetical protein
MTTTYLESTPSATCNVYDLGDEKTLSVTRQPNGTYAYCTQHPIEPEDLRASIINNAVIQVLAEINQRRTVKFVIFVTKYNLVQAGPGSSPGSYDISVGDKHEWTRRYSDLVGAIQNILEKVYDEGHLINLNGEIKIDLSH